MWKGDPSGTGAYLNEVKLTPANVNAGQFGRLGSFQADGIVMGQPLYVSELDVAAAGTRNVIILTTEHDSVYAIDADNPGSGPLWERHYVDPANRVTTMPDSFGGRTTLGGEVGITGTPYIDGQTGVLYFVTTLSRNGGRSSGCGRSISTPVMISGREAYRFKPAWRAMGGAVSTGRSLLTLPTRTSARR